MSDSLKAYEGPTTILGVACTVCRLLGHRWRASAKSWPEVEACGLEHFRYKHAGLDVQVKE